MQGLWLHPARLVPLAFLILIGAGTAALMLPAAKAGPGGAPFLVALFTATSAVSVTGLAVVDTAVYWTRFGQGVIFALFQLGGFGIMSAATLLVMLVSRRLSLSRQLVLQAETRGIALGDVLGVLRFTLALFAAVQTVLALAMTLRFMQGGMAPGEAAWQGLFHAGAAFTNSGFTILTGGLIAHQGDAPLLLLIVAGVLIGGIGLPVLYELRRGGRRLPGQKGESRGPRAWSLHTRLTLLGSAALLPVSFALILIFEGGNPATLGPMDWPQKALNALFHAVNTRSGGLNSFDTGAIDEDTMLLSYALMMIGGGSAGTAGGIKVTTFLILGLAVWSEIRGHPDVTIFGRRISSTVQREALTIALLAIMVVAVSVMVMHWLSDLPLRRLVFEVISAFANVGLSMGITAELPPAGQLLLVLLMFIGRIGTITIATALALRSRNVAYRYPEERPIVG